MKEYGVTWSIDIEADDPEEAARMALEIQRDKDSTATIFSVTDADNETVIVDLASIPNTRTADGHWIRLGERYYDYYNREPGRLATLPEVNGWFRFVHDNGSKCLLNGERICSMSHAEHMGWT